ncbi:histidine phosphatase family protein [Geomicrobium sp. JCM 19038]|uniref:histidine phosphatase family protein n=1 Tax=Geomicrobium sp. JCM 19038 TaxID=1460635 RepID=UPI00045F12F5|nr:histidine phosphatase family protein [Geomicrobium sp. JCM 19038]GAK08699.1 phosphoglycerate mutase family 2 [Geomicrobium sp. JCM 19038]
MSTSCYFIRHAHATYSDDDRNRRLSSIGRIQSEAIAKQFESIRVDQIVSSPYHRAIQTIEPLAKQKGLSVQLEDAFRERESGLGFEQNFEEKIKALWESPDLYYGSGESNAQAQRRGQAATKQLIEAYENKSVVIATHGNLLALILSAYDPTFTFESWRTMPMPAVYNVIVSKTQVDIKAIDLS